MNIIDEPQIHAYLPGISADASRVRAILAKALEVEGLDLSEVAILSSLKDPNLIRELFETARKVKDIIYGKRLVLFAPLYISNFCANDCAYCAFRESNKNISRRALTPSEIAAETKVLINQGHKRVLLVAGEEDTPESFQHVLKAIETIYQTKSKRGEIRRININVAPLTIEEFKQLKQARIGTYQLFQETYDRTAYEQVHLSGKKRDYEARLKAMDHAMQAGIDDVGIGVLFGLTDFRFEVLALLQHAAHLEKTYGVGPHTISVPRIEPANGSYLSSHPPSAVSDCDFAKIIAILRLAVPYTGIILSTRETADMRQKALALGVSQISAGSCTGPGGYSEGDSPLRGQSPSASKGTNNEGTVPIGDCPRETSQFSLGDHRSLDEVIRDVASLGYIPSFCTGCYRLGRTGKHFMELAKPGDIKSICEPNAIVTFYEYLCDYASKETRQIGERLIQQELAKMPTHRRDQISSFIDQIKHGKRDVFI